MKCQMDTNQPENGKSNSANGRNSFDSTSTGELVAFINRNVTPYPTEVGAPKFDMVDVESERDLELNQARQFANEELSRLNEHAEVLQRQYRALERRVMLTELVHQAHYMFIPQVGQVYHLYQESTQFQNRTVLIRTGPAQWSSGIPEGLTFLGSVRKLGDNTWEGIGETDT